MLDRVEVKAWHQGGKPPVLTLFVDAETVVRLSPDDADELAQKLLFFAQFARHHVKRQRGSDAPHQHYREPGDPCPFALPRDVHFFIGEALSSDAVGVGYPPCPYCCPVVCDTVEADSSIA